jgi:hypothetical protein
LKFVVKITAFVNEIAAAHPDKVTVSSIGKSHENRDIPLVKISTGGSGKKAIVIDGGKLFLKAFESKTLKPLKKYGRLANCLPYPGIHAREWISPAFVTWLINELVENYAAHPQYVDNVDWYVMH